MATTKRWKKGRGKLGIFAPLIGSWIAEDDSPRGAVRCNRTFARVLDGKYVQLDASWDFGRSTYEERALFGIDENGRVAFWSFTSDGKRSQGHLVDVADLHVEALGFEAQMPAGLARQAYWPGDEGRVEWVVESRTKKGWNRFVHHRYERA